jgi:hypothetical protein
MAAPPAGGVLHANMSGEFGHTAITELWVPIVVGSHAFAAFWLYRAWRLNAPGGCRRPRASSGGSVAGSTTSNRSAWKLLAPSMQWPGRHAGGKGGLKAAAAAPEAPRAGSKGKGDLELVVQEDDLACEATKDLEAVGATVDQEEVRKGDAQARGRAGRGLPGPRAPAPRGRGSPCARAIGGARGAGRGGFWMRQRPAGTAGCGPATTALTPR